MGKLVNVEVMAPRDKQKQGLWSRLSTWAVGSTALVAGSSAMAAEGDPVNFLANATSSIGSIAGDLGIFFLAVIGISLLIAAFSISKGGIKRGSNA